jgi:hypothetical protein
MRYVVLMAAALLTACSAGQSTSAPQPTSSSQPDIPAVSKPLDTKAFIADPCGLLTEANRMEIGLPTATKDNASCNLHTGPAGASPLEFLRIQVMADRGLADIQAQCGTSASARCDTWSVDSVNGYPLLRANGETERRYGSCKEFLGVSDNAVVLINDVRTGKATNPDCTRSDKVAAMVITKLSQ